MAGKRQLSAKHAAAAAVVSDSDSDSPYAKVRSRAANSEKFAQVSRTRAKQGLSRHAESQGMPEPAPVPGQGASSSAGGVSSSNVGGANSSSDAGSVRLVENRYGAFEVYHADKQIGRLTSWPNPTTGALQFAAKCESHRGCSIMYNANTYPGQQPLVQWLVDGMNVPASSHHRMRPVKSQRSS